MLLVECALLLVLLAPMPSNQVRYAIVWVCERLSASKRVRTVQYVLGVLILLLFMDSIRTIHIIDDHMGSPGAVRSELSERMSLFRNQRNAFITGFMLYFGIVLYRVQHITVQIYRLRKGHGDAVPEGKQEKLTR